MRMIIPFDAFDKLATVRSQYEELKHINLNLPQSKIGLPTIAGGVDAPLRLKQISFLEKILHVMGFNLLNEHVPATAEQYIAHLAASKFCIVAAWYVQSQLRGSSKLYTIIDNNLGITSLNYPDEEDKKECFAAAYDLIKIHKALIQANSALVKDGYEALSSAEWSDFKLYIKKAHETKNDRSRRFKDSPFTSLTEPLFKTAFSYTGATLGMLGGDIISQSTQGVAVKYQLTAMIGSSLLVLGRAGPAGIALFAPVIATRLISSFCSISLTHILGVSMGMLGKNIGTVVGFPLDLTYRLVWNVCASIGNYCTGAHQPLMLSGIRIADGKMLINGMEVALRLVDEKLPAGVTHVIEFDNKGSIYVNGEVATLQKDAIPKDLVVQFTDYFASSEEGGAVKKCKVKVDEEIKKPEELEESEPRTLGSRAFA